MESSNDRHTSSAALFTAAAHAVAPHKTNAMQRRILRMRDLCAYLGIGQSTAYQWIVEGRLPPADIRLGVGVVGWDVHTIDAYIEQHRVTH